MARAITFIIITLSLVFVFTQLMGSGYSVVGPHPPLK